MHLGEAAFESEPIGGVGTGLSALQGAGPAVLGVPDVMSDEFLQGDPPLVGQIFLCDVANGCHQSLHVFNKDVVASDKDFFLRGLRGGRFLCCLGSGGRLRG